MVTAMVELIRNESSKLFTGSNTWLQVSNSLGDHISYLATNYSIYAESKLLKYNM